MIWVPSITVSPDIKSGDLPLTASTVHVNDVFKRLEDTLKKLNYAEDYIRKLEKRFEGLEDNLSTAVAAAVVDALEDPATLKWMTNLVSGILITKISCPDHNHRRPVCGIRCPTQLDSNGQSLERLKPFPKSVPWKGSSTFFLPLVHSEKG